MGTKLWYNRTTVVNLQKKKRFLTIITQHQVIALHHVLLTKFWVTCAMLSVVSHMGPSKFGKLEI